MSKDNSSKNIFFNTLLTVCQFVFPLITFPYLARILMPEGLGVVNFLDNIIQYLIFIVGLGIPIYGVREIARARKDIAERQKLFNELLFINILSAAGILIVYSIVLYVLRAQLVNMQLYILSGFVVLLNIFNVEWLFQGLEEFSYITRRSIGVKTIAIILTFCFVKNPDDIILYYYIMILSYFINAAVNLNYARGKFDFKINMSVKVLSLQRHIKPILLIFSANLAISLFLYFDSFILGVLSGTKSVGLYMTAIKLVKIPVMVIAAFINALVPQISYAVKEKDFDAVNKLIGRSFNYVVFLSIPLVMGIFLSADFIIYIFAGKNYTESVLPLRIMCPAIFPLALTNIFVWQVLTPFSRERYFMITVIAGMVASLSINFVLIPLIAQNGTAISTLVTETMICLLSFVFSKKVFKYSINGMKILQSLVACIPMLAAYFIVSNLISDFMIRNILFIVISVMSYFLLQVYWFKNNILKDFRFS
jgi:O-antigen/teichoic acid export membrane protein